MRLMNKWILRDRPMKIKWTTSNEASSLHAMRHNLDASSWIGQTQLKDVDSWIVIESQPLIKSKRRIQQSDGEFSQYKNTRVPMEPRYALRKRTHPQLQQHAILFLIQKFEKLTIHEVSE